MMFRISNLSVELEACYMCPSEAGSSVRQKKRRKYSETVRATNIQFPYCKRRHRFYEGRIGKRPCHHRKDKHRIQVILGYCVVVLAVLAVQRSKINETFIILSVSKVRRTPFIVESKEQLSKTMTKYKFCELRNRILFGT